MLGFYNGQQDSGIGELREKYNPLVLQMIIAGSRALR